MIAEADIDGVILVKKKTRFYPGATSTAHVIGLMGYQGDLYAGRYGLEREYENVLKRDQILTFKNFFIETFSTIKNISGQTAADSEGDIVITIEPVVQKFLETQLAETIETWNAETIAGLVMDPLSGEILALASWPAFDPGGHPSSLGVLTNPMVEHIYEMGSIIKPLVMAAALDAGVVTPETTYNDAGCLTLNKRKICNYDGKARGLATMQDVLGQSLNVGMVFVEQQLGQKKFKDYMYAFGLNEKTGIDLPGELEGKLRNLNSKYEVDFATAAYGQGIALTPIATARALAALGNGGYLVRPHVVKEINYRSRLAQVIKPEIGPQAIDARTSEEISRMLVKVVDEKLAGGTKKLEHYSVAAKTGTAQMVDPATGKYYDDRYLHSFFGYFPAFNPRFLVFMFMKNPKGVRYSSETLTEPFSNLTKFLLNYYQVAPDR